MPNVDHLSWDEIGRISAGGDALTRLGLGATKTEYLRDGSQMLLRIIDFDHDELEGGGTAPITWETTHVLPKRRMNRNCGNWCSWEYSDIRRWLNRDFSELLSDELQGIIKPVVKLTSAGETSPDIIRTVDRLWIPSEVEVFGRTEYSYPGEGTQYRFYTEEGRRHPRRTMQAASAFWWLRSPNRGNSSYFCVVSTDGSPSYHYAFSSRGLVVALAV